MKDFLDELDNELMWMEPKNSPIIKEEKIIENNIPKTNVVKNNNDKIKNTNNITRKINIIKKEDINKKIIIKKENSLPKKEIKVTLANKNNKTNNNKVTKNTNKNQQNKRKTQVNRNYNNNNNGLWKFVSKFPETKFYLPSLREWYTRFIPIGWNNETWSKNMWMVQYEDDIVLIDCWVQFTDSSLPWVNYSIPDVSFLTKYKKQIKGLVITHAHLDHIWALKHALPALWMPTIYWTKLTIGFIKKQLIEAQILDYATLVEVDAWLEKTIKIGKFDVEFFKVNHSVPDSAWFVITSPSWTRFMHTWDFKIDHSPEIDEPANLERIQNIWKSWITLLLSDSTWSTRKWYSMSEKNVWEALEKTVSQHTRWRLIIAAFSSWISRVQQLVNICEKYDKTIFLSWKSMIENVAIAKELWYLKVKPGIIKKMTAKNTEWIPPHKQVIITTWSQWEQFSALTRMAEWKHNAVEIIKWDTVIFSSSIVPWNDKSVVTIINKLIKLWSNVITKDDWEFHTGWHAFQEEQKVMLGLVNPKYFMPVYWDLYYRTVHKNLAISTWFNKENIILLENGHIIDFAPKWTSLFKSRIKVPIQNIIIDSNVMALANSHVIKAREKMMESWVLVINYKVDKKTRAILWNLKLETRWLVYLEQVRDVHKMIIKKSKDLYENTICDVPDILEKDLLKIIKTDLEKYLLYRIERDPMIIPIITEV